MAFKNIVFDIDGTLTDTEEAILSALKEAVEAETGNKVEYEDLKFSFGIPGAETVKILKCPDTEKALKLWEDNVIKYKDKITVFNGIEELLKKLKNSGYKLGVVTSKNRYELETQFEPYGLSDYFDIEVCSDDTLKHKPDGEPLKFYISKSGADYKETLYIGDSIYDMQCAKNAGVVSALAVWGSKTKNIPADFYLEEPSDLLKILE